MPTCAPMSWTEKHCWHRLSVINDRSFGEDKMKVAVKGVEYSDGLQSMNVLACAKHFPGHGDTDKDSHKTLPTVRKSLEQLENFEFYPFKVMIANGVGSMMVAHLNIPALDTTPNITTSLSQKVVTDLLKDGTCCDGRRQLLLECRYCLES